MVSVEAEECVWATLTGIFCRSRTAGTRKMKIRFRV